jgi:hypothetical protein
LEEKMEKPGGIQKIKALKFAFEERAKPALPGAASSAGPEDFISYAAQLDAALENLQKDNHASAMKILAALEKTLKKKAAASSNTAGRLPYFTPERTQWQDDANAFTRLARIVAGLESSVKEEEEDYNRKHAADDPGRMLTTAQAEVSQAPKLTYQLANLVVAASRHIIRQDEEISAMKERLSSLEATLREMESGKTLDKPRPVKAAGPEPRNS